MNGTVHCSIASPGPAWTSEDIRGELSSLEASQSFRRAPGLVSLLRFLVETELQGGGADLKETVVGMAVYHRAPNYDPKIDGVVRVNANRLRRRLADHYFKHPSLLQIRLEAGSYRPRFIQIQPNVTDPRSPHAPTLGTAPEAPHRLRWAAGWLAAGLLLCVLGPLLWMAHSKQQRWSQHSISGMTGLQQFPDFSPDNRNIAYAIFDRDTNTSRLYVQDIGSNTPTRLTNTNRYETRPAWSPDGKKLAFVVRNSDLSLHVFVRPLQGGAETEIFSRASSGPWLCDVPRVSWRRDGTEIITTAPPSQGELAANQAQSIGCGLVAINTTTHAVRRLTRSPKIMLGDLEPTVSPDGRTVAFLRQVSYAMLDIFLVDIDGTHERRVPHIREDIQGIAWMPDGKSLLLCARMGGDQLHIARLELQSSNTYPIQSGAAPMAFATISPDGHHIAFTEYHQRNKVLRLQEGSLQTIFDDGTLRLNAATSPDGRLLAYTSDRTGRNQIWVSDSEGRHEHVVASSHSAATRPVWSADSKFLIYECRDQGPSAICITSLDGKTGRLLLRMDGDAILPSISRDGKRLYFTSNRTGTYEAYRQQLHMAANGELSAAGKPEQVTSGGADFVSESATGKTLYLLGPLPFLRFLAVPNTATVIHTRLEKDQNTSLEEQHSENDCGVVTGEGLLIASEHAGKYQFSQYREFSKTPVELIAPQHIDPLDGMSWDTTRNALLLSTRSTPIGELNLLSDRE